MKSAMSKRVIALVMVASLSSTTLVEAAEIKKDESVFVSLNTNGELEKTTVSNWIHSDDSDLTIKDKTELSNVKNVKGDTEPEQSGQVLTWRMDGSNLYYQGTTKKPLPIGVKIKYYLDGKEMQAEDLGGKSGKVKIELSLENKSYKDVDINGKQRRIYTPFTTATVVNLPVDKFSNVTTDGGNMISEGNNNIVSFVAAPGLTESLGVDSLGIDLKLKDTMTIEADVENFSLKPIMVTASPNLLNLDELNNIDENTKISEVKEKLDALKDNMNLLVDGTGQLKSGINAAKPKLDNALSEMNSPSMQEKMSLITDDNKVSGARKLIEDAYYAKNVPTDKIVARVSGIYNDAMGMYNNKIQPIVSLYNDFNTKDKPAMVNDYNEFNYKYKPLIESGMNDMKNFASSNEVKALLLSVEKLKKQYELNQGALSKVDKLAKVATDENNIKLIKQLMSDANQAKVKLESIEKEVKEKQANIGRIKGGVSNISSMNMDQMKQDIGSYESAYLVVKGELIAALKSGHLEEKKAELNKVIDNIYGGKAELKALVNSFNQAKLTSQSDVARMQGYNKTLESLGALRKDINEVMPIVNNVEALKDDETLKRLLEEIDAAENMAANLQKMMPSPEEQKGLGEMLGTAKNIKLQVDKINPYIEGITEKLNQLNQNGLKDDIQKYSSDINKINGLVSELNNKKVDPEAIKKYIEGAVNKDDINEVVGISRKLLEMQKDLQDNEDILRITQDALQSGNVERARNLINSIPESKGKIQELIDGINKLDEGANRYKNEGIDVLYDKGNEATNSIEEVSLAKDELVKASDEYGTFSGKADDMIGTTKFIMKTAEIEEPAPEEPEVKEVKQEKKGFFAWLKSLFVH